VEIELFVLWAAAWLTMLCALVVGIVWADGPARYQAWAQTRDEADDRGRRLLEDWLSPAQREQYRRWRYFEVIGSNSGRRYRIRQGRQMNIDELDRNGKRMALWCFVPAGRLPVGDVPLAQRIALESDEQNTLAIAHKNPCWSEMRILRIVISLQRWFWSKGSTAPPRHQRSGAARAL
jgi:hypothetical protein